MSPEREGSEKLYYSISEVCSMTGLKPHVLRYWETAFPMLSPSKNQAGNRVYTPEEVRLIKTIGRLLYDERYTIDGARRKVEEMGSSSGQMQLGLDGVNVSPEALEEIRRELEEVLAILDRDPMKVDGSGREGS